MATYTIRNNTTQDWRDTAMSKAQFEALAAERRTNRAGSGFDEFGKIHTTYLSQYRINEGLTTVNPANGSSYANSFIMGFPTSSTGTSSGTSLSNVPKVSINGIYHKIEGTKIDPTYYANQIFLPPAPTVLPYDATLTQQQIDSGVIKHADASNSGLIVNGKFDTDTTWIKETGWSIIGGVASSNGAQIASSYLYQMYPFVAGKQYVIELTATSITAGLVYAYYYDGLLNRSVALSSAGRVTLTFTGDGTSRPFGVEANADFIGSIDNISVFPADAISRSDLVFLESWHEDVSEKDFVYPLGNVQYLGTTGDAGTTVAGAFAGSATYSLFSDTWQADSALVGKGYVWSTLSDANKKVFVANPENNCYLDGDKVIQVRYRMRVVMGTGDTWNNTTLTTLGSSSNVLARQSSGTYAVKVKGKQVDIADDVVSSSSLMFFSYDHISNTNKETGVYTSYLNTATSYNGYTFALPIALVHRRNQGAYHPVYNSNGASRFNDINTANFIQPWYTSVAYKPNSISDCFVYKNSVDGTVLTGNIGTTSGRPDGLFYDQIHEGDILDLRMSSQKVEDYNRLIDREFNKLVAGTYRGSEGEWVNVLNGTFTATGNSSSVFYFTTTQPSWWSTSASGTVVYDENIDVHVIFSGNGYRTKTRLYASGSGYGVIIGVPVTAGQTAIIVVSVKTTRTKSNTLTHCDIIGSPANYPTAWKQSGVSGVPLIVAEDGTSYLPNASNTVWKLSKKFISTAFMQALKSTDNGATWTALTWVASAPTSTQYMFSSVNNTVTFGSAPASTDLIMVTYQTHTNMSVPAVNSEVLGVGDVVSINAYESQHGVNIASNMIMKVPVWYGVNRGVKFTWYETIANAFWANSARYPIHSALSFNQFGSSNPAVKTFPYLTRSNGKAYLNLVFKEMKYNGTSWGDDSKFNIVDNVSTTTDNNGATVLIGQKKVELPYFIGQGE